MPRWITGRRQDQASGRRQTFRAHLPEFLSTRAATPLTAPVLTVLLNATGAMARADRHPLLGLPPFRRALLHVEAIGSSWFEGIHIGHRRLEEAVALAYGDEGGSPGEAARAVIGNIEATERAIQLASGRPVWSPELICEIHQTLLAGSHDAALGGWIRDDYVWIGGATPDRAKYVAPPAESVVDYLVDLCEYMNRTDVDPISQTAFSHAQFELIHPFADGNGRAGRCLIQALLRQRGLSLVVPMPFSQVVTGSPDAYIDGITAFRDGDDAAWVRTFGQLLDVAAEEASTAGEELGDLLVGWRERLSGYRKHSVVHRLPELLVGRPVLTASIAAAELGVSREAARLALIELERVGIVKDVNIGRGRRGHISPDVIRLANRLEARLRSRTV